jgi:TonB-dependent receptor
MISRQAMLCGVAVVAMAQAVPAAAQERVFNVPAQPALRAIPELARQAQVQIVAPASDLTGIVTPAVRGQMSVRHAVERLIAGTHLRIVADDGQTIALRSATQDSPGRSSTPAAPQASRQQGDGSVRGRIRNQVTGSYLRNAEVSVVGTGIVGWSDEGGTFRLGNVPAGQVTIVVRYTGLRDRQVVATVTPGGTVDLGEVTLESQTFDGGVLADGTAITVTAIRDGQAAAIQERRASANAKTVVAADNYGLQTMGDVGEFMKSMPGISLDYTEVDATAVRIGGLDPKYSTFTTDGARMATATSNNNSGRQNSFEQMSITGIDSIELNNTLTARMDADAPGGTINLRSKYAFQRSNRLFRIQLGAIGTSDAGLSPIYLPDDRKHARIYPSLGVGYGDVFLNGDLGVAFNASYNANYVQQDRIQTDWSYLPDGRVLPYQVMWRPGPKLTSRTAANLTLDYRASDNLTLSLRSTYSFYDVEYFNQYTYLTFGTTTRSYATPDSTPTDITVNPAGTNTRLRTEYSHRYAGTPAWLIAPKIEWKDDAFEATLRGSYSTSEFNFRDTSKGFFQRTNTQVTGLGFTIIRPDEASNRWTLTQTAGRDWGDPTSWNRDADIGNNIRTAESDAVNEMYGANLDLRRELQAGAIDVSLFAGGAARVNDWRTTEGAFEQFQYVGPNGDLSQRDAAAVVPATVNYDFEILGFDAGNMNQQNWRADSNYATYDLYREHPDWFVPDTLGNLTRKLENDRGVKEDIYAGYLEGQARWGDLLFDLGFRYERTETGARVADIRTDEEVAAAGYALNTAEGILYQYNDGQYGVRRGRYEDWFLSGSVKYDITDSLVAHVAFSDSILRPDYGNLGGVVSVNDDTQVVTVPNPLLRPERSTKYFASLQYYLEPSGIVGISLYKLDLSDMQVTGIEVDAASVGFDPDEYSGYIFRSAQNVPGISTNNGMILEYDQQFTFLPGALKGLGLRGSVTLVDPDGERVNLPKQSANWGVRYSYDGFDIQLTGNWQSKYRVSGLANTLTTPNNGILYHTDRQLWNLSLAYRINPNFELTVAGRNIFNSPDVIYSNVESRVRQYTIYGSMWNAGVRITF